MLTVSVAFPSFTPVTRPVAPFCPVPLTVTEAGLSVPHATDLICTLETTAISFASPFFSSRLAGFRLNAACSSVTVTVQDAETPSAVAVIVVLPAATAVTVPFISTVATFLFPDIHAGVAPVLTVAFKTLLSPFFRVMA